MLPRRSPHYKKIIFSLGLMVLVASSYFIISPVVANAASVTVSSTPIDTGLTPVGQNIGLGGTDIRVIIAKIIRAVLGLLGIIAVTLVIYGGFVYMTAGGNEEKVAEAKKILVNALIGLVIILSSFAIVSFVISKLVEATTGNISGGGRGDITIDTTNYSNIFYVARLPSVGQTCVRNVHPMVVFSKNVDLATVRDNLSLLDISNVSVSGTWNYGETRNVVVFTPVGQCGSGAPDCLAPSSTYSLVFKNINTVTKISPIKTLNENNPELNLECKYKAGCDRTSFTTGDGVDRQPPTIDIMYPVLASPLEVGSIVPVVVNYADDNGVQNIALASSLKSAPSSRIVADNVGIAGCSKMGSVTLNWPTAQLAVATHTLYAIGTDWAGFSGVTTEDAMLKPNHCFDGVSNNGEAALPKFDCGGNNVCGKCQGDSCSENAQCSSGACQDGICKNVMSIESFSPPQGGPGTYVSILGRYFGKTPGKVYFALKNNPTSPADWIEAGVPNGCSQFDRWNDGQIIAEVPPGAAIAGTSLNRAIKVETAPFAGATGATTTIDTTRNHGLPDFIVNNVFPPAICRIDPNSGPSGTAITLEGKRFGQLTSANDLVLFGDLRAVVAQNNNNTPAWADNTIVALVPAIDSGHVGVRVVRDLIESNSVRFTAESRSITTTPIISNVTPEVGVAGDYITITGSNFGTNPGTVWFKDRANPGNPTIFGSADFPADCKGNIWQDKQIIIKFPGSGGTPHTVYTVQIDTPEHRTSPLDVNQLFSLELGQPAPGLCKISPLSAPIPFSPTNPGDKVVLSGENFLVRNTTPDDINVYFWSGNGQANSIVGRPVAPHNPPFRVGASTIDVRPPNETKTGAVSVYRVTDQKISNPVKFSAFDCRNNSQACGNGLQCCKGLGTCIADTLVCPNETRSTGYAWRFSTQDIPPVPHVVERCDSTVAAGQALPSPSPSIQWDANIQDVGHRVCRGALVTAEFTTALNVASLPGNVQINRCTSVDVSRNCTNPQAISPSDYAVDLEPASSFAGSSVGGAQHDFLTIQRRTKWDAGIWYQVVLKTGIRSIGNATTSQALAADKPCGAGTAYCFVFQAGTSDCTLGQVIVTPYSYWTNVLEAPIKRRTLDGAVNNLYFRGNGLSSQRCIMMDVSDYAWQWHAADPAFADIFGLSATRTIQATANANTVGILPGDSTKLAASATTNTASGLSTKTGTSTLTIDLSNPEVIDFWPKCQEACTNAEVGVNFNISMSNFNLPGTRLGPVQLLECIDENCFSTLSVATSSDIIFDPSSRNTILKIANSQNASVSLNKNTKYKVIVSVETTNLNDSRLLWAAAKSSDFNLAGKPYRKAFSWVFHTKKDACLISRVDVAPKIFEAQLNSDRAIFAAQPYSAPDSCSPVTGQKINPWTVDWSWASSDSAVATLSHFSTIGSNPNCSASCVRKGSDISAAFVSSTVPVCGNGIIEAGEDCDQPSFGQRCGLDCRFMGNLSTTSTTSTIDLGLCGDGFITPAKGEACDLGDPQSAIGCSSDCRHLGSLLKTSTFDTQASVCGNGTLGSGEDCDLGKINNPLDKTSAFGCSDKCLHNGTRLSRAWCFDSAAGSGFTTSTWQNACSAAISQCGDKIQSPDEDAGCDSPSGWNNVLCTDRCLLKTGDSPSDKTVTDCSVTPTPVGCSSGSHGGSSLLYSTPSVCGDAIVGLGEDAVCEMRSSFSNTSHSGLTDPWALAIGVGRGGPSGTPPAQRATVAAVTNNQTTGGASVRGSGQFVIACGYKTDAECQDAFGQPGSTANYGVGADSCCYARPSLISTLPQNGAGGICANTALEATFDGQIDITTLAGNLLIARGVTSTAACSSTRDVTALVLESPSVASLSWYQTTFNFVLAFIRNLFGATASANIPPPPVAWCTGKDSGAPTIIAITTSTSKISVQLDAPLASATNYAVILTPGVKDIYGVSIGKNAAGKNNNWKFSTSEHTCQVNKITVSPSKWYFSRPNATTTLTAVAYYDPAAGSSLSSPSALPGPNAQLIQPIIGSYSWAFRWSPTDNGSVAVPDTRSSNTTVSSLNKNGEVDVHASAVLVDNKISTATGTVATGSSHIIVFLCENPWPPKDLYLTTSKQVCTNSPDVCSTGPKKCKVNGQLTNTACSVDFDCAPPSTVVAASDITMPPPYVSAGATCNEYLFPGSVNQSYYTCQTGYTSPLGDDSATFGLQLLCLDPANLGNNCSVRLDNYYLPVALKSTRVNTNRALSFSCEAAPVCVPQAPSCTTVPVATGPFTIFPYEDAATNNDAYSFDSNSFTNTRVPPSSPVSAAIGDGYFNFSTYYCADNGSSGTFDDLPYLRPVVQTLASDLRLQHGTCETSGSTCTTDTDCGVDAISHRLRKCYDYPPLKRFIFTNTSLAASNDAIGIQVFSNPEHLSAEAWYSKDKAAGGQGFSGNIQHITIDGYDAVSDGSNIYIDALNYVDAMRSLYSNIYLFSINSDAAPATRRVFAELINNLHLNTNLTNNDGYCGLTMATPGTTKKCSTDLNCDFGQVCAVQTDKLKRNYQRFRDFQAIDVALTAYAQKNKGKYPDLKAGTYLAGQTISTWSSWSVLGNAVGGVLPSDPINQLGPAGTCTPATSTQFSTVEAECAAGHCNQFCTTDSQCPFGSKCTPHQPSTGWSTTDRRFSFACATSSYAYRYQFSTSTGFRILSNFENPFEMVDVVNRNDFFQGFGFSNPDRFVPNGSNGICNNDQEVSTLIQGRCGDGQVNVSSDPAKNEECDPPGKKVYDKTACLANGTGTSTMKICTNSCHWSTASTVANGAVGSCKETTKCGNGSIDPGETCDDGTLNGRYNHCNKQCSSLVAAFISTTPNLSPGYCGDGEINPAYEICDIFQEFGRDEIFETGATRTVLAPNVSSQFCVVSGDFTTDPCVASADCGIGGICEPRLDQFCKKNNVFTSTRCNDTAFCYATLASKLQKSLVAGTNPQDVVSSSPDGNYFIYPDITTEVSVTGLVNSDIQINQLKNKTIGTITYRTRCSITTAPFDCDVYVDYTQNGRSYYGRINVSLEPVQCNATSCPATVRNIGGGAPVPYTNLSSNQVTVSFNKVATSVSCDYRPRGGCDTDPSRCAVDCSDPLQQSLCHTVVEKVTSTRHISTIAATGQSKYGLSKVDSCNFDCQTYGPYCGDTIIQSQEQCDGNESCQDANGKDGFKICSNDCQTKVGVVAGLWTCSTTPTVVITPTIGTAYCGNAKIDSDEACDDSFANNSGEIILSNNGRVCVPGYGKSCSYCAAGCKNVVNIQPQAYCGDGMVNGPEICDTAGGTIYMKVQNTTTTASALVNGGYAALACNQELTDPGTFKKGTKVCVNNCRNLSITQTGAGSCVRCGIDANGTEVGGGIINVLIRTSTDPLEVGFGKKTPDYGYVQIFGYSATHRDELADAYFNKPSNSSMAAVVDSAYTLKNANLPVRLNPNSLCYDGSGENYTMMVNENVVYASANRPSNAFTFSVLKNPDPWSYELLLSPIISSVGLKDISGNLPSSARPNDLRIVVSWVGAGSFASGFVRPQTGSSATLEGQSGVPATNGFDYYLQPSSTPLWGLWYHGLGQTIGGKIHEEAYTIDTSALSTSTYMFYVKTKSVSANDPTPPSIKNFFTTAQLKVSVYLPEDRRAFYNVFSQPVATYYLKEADVSTINNSASYWHVFNIKQFVGSQIGPVSDVIKFSTLYPSVDNVSVTTTYDKGRIVTGANQFIY